MNRKIIRLTMDEEQIRLDKWLARRLPRFSRSEIARLLAQGKILVDGYDQVKAKDIIAVNTQITVCAPEPEESHLIAQQMDLDILYEDADVLVINKPQGLVVHPAPGHPDGTLSNALLAHCQADLSDLGGAFRPGIVHRLDKDTAGLLIVAKNNQAHRALAQQLSERVMTRGYRALVWGCPKSLKGTIEAPIGRHLQERQKMVVIAGGKASRTRFEVRERFAGASELDLRLDTGRTHQIRVHLAYIGHPVIGDPVYAPGRPDFALRGQALQSYRLQFTHPRSGETMNFEITPPDWYHDLRGRLERGG